MHRRIVDDPKNPGFNGVGFIISNYLKGAALGLAFTVLFLAGDIGGLRTLAAADSNTFVAVAVLTTGMVLTFAALFTGAAIMFTFSGRDR
jgi:voltage-gated potassium channel Kch